LTKKINSILITYEIFYNFGIQWFFWYYTAFSRFLQQEAKTNLSLKHNLQSTLWTKLVT